MTMLRSSTKAVKLDHLFISLFVLGLLLLAFAAGAFATYFKWFPYQLMREAMEAKEAFKMQNQELQQAKQRVLSMREGNPVSVYKKAEVFDGYTLFSVDPTSAAHLIDMEGKEVHRWQRPYSQSFSVDADKKELMDKLVYWLHPHLFPNGDLLVTMQIKAYTPYGYGLLKLDKNSNLIWAYGEHLHHYIDLGPDGRIYGLIQNMILSEEYEGFKFDTKYVLDDFIVVLTPDGKETMRISLLKAFSKSEYKSLLPSPITSFDALHANSTMVLTTEMAKAFPMFKPGQILVSMREIKAIGVVDPETEKFVWAAKGPWKKQHDAQFAADGTIMVFDNQGGKKNVSRIIKYYPATNKFNVLFQGTEDFPFYSRASGRYQMLSNGNLLITESQRGNVFELNSKNELVWKWQTPQLVDGKPATINHAQRYTTEQVEFLRSQSR